LAAQAARSVPLKVVKAKAGRLQRLVAGSPGPITISPVAQKDMAVRR